MSASPGTIDRTRAALRSGDFRKLVAIRLIGQCGDGFFQAALVASVVFAPEDQSTTVGLFKAYLIVALPFTVLGPFVGVFIDRWPRRAILTVAPLVKAALVGAALFDPTTEAWPFYAGTLLVISVNRFLLAAAQAVVPRLVPREDLLMANSIATVGGTVALLVGVFVGGRIVDAVGSSVPVVVVAGLSAVVASVIAGRMRSDLAPHTLPEAPELLRHEIRRVLVEFRDGVGRVVRTPRALGPITSITVDQIGQGVILTLSLVVFREEFGEGVGSFSNLIGAGGIGVLVGIATVGALEERFAKERIVAGAFVLGGATLLAVALVLTDVAILVAAGVVGLAFAWKKIPVDTIVQSSLPDGYRGRVFAAYDVFYNASRVVAAGLAIPMFPALGTRWSIAVVAIAFVLWAPVLPRWIGGRPALRIRFVEGGSAEERPVAIAWGDVVEPVDLLDERLDERDAERRRRLRLRLQDGTVLDVSRRLAGGEWEVDREREGPER
ncbi:MAG TPA: MFS transporter [Actinomycetota bacterium]|nr:MFS transporter [Actinomycetota bacterium]